MTRPDLSPRPRIIPSTTASPLLSPTGACSKSSPTETNQASVMLSRLTSRNKVQSTQSTPGANTEAVDYFSRKSFGFSRSNTVTGTQEVKATTHASAYVSFPAFDQYQRRDAIPANVR